MLVKGKEKGGREVGRQEGRLPAYEHHRNREKETYLFSPLWYFVLSYLVLTTILKCGCYYPSFMEEESRKQERDVIIGPKVTQLVNDRIKS